MSVMLRCFPCYPCYLEYDSQIAALEFMCLSHTSE